MADQPVPGRQPRPSLIFHSLKNLGQFFRSRPESSTSHLEFLVEDCEERIMLDAEELVFRADFEDAPVAPGNYALVSEVSGMSTTGPWVEIQNNHPAVGPAAQGSKHAELDGTNGIFVDLDEGPATDLKVTFFYSPRPGVSRDLNAIEIHWNGNLVETVADEGAGLRTTRFREVTVQLDGGTGRLEFRSNSEGGSVGLGGLIDDIRVTRSIAAPEIKPIDDQTLQVGETLDLTAELLPPNENAEGMTFRLVQGPEGMAIDPVTGQLTWIASQANINEGDKEKDSGEVGERILVFQSGFEDVAVPRGRWGSAQSISGFQVNGSSVEIQNNIPGIGPAAEGNQHLEIDGTVGIFRDIETIPGDQYELELAFSPRPGIGAAANAIEIWWDGQLLETITASGIGLTSTAFRNYSFNLSSFTGDLTRLELRSQSRNNPPGFGGLIDNVRLYRRPVEPDECAVHEFDVVIEVEDSRGQTDRESFQVVVDTNAGEQAPVLEEIDDQVLQVGETLDLTAELLPPNENAEGMTYRLVQGPEGMTIDPATGQLTWVASQVNIDSTDEKNASIEVGEPVLLFQSGFEDVAVPRGRWGSAQSISGFQVIGSSVEIQNNIPGIGPAAEGNQHLELDGTVGIFRDVETIPGDQYELKLAFSPRPGINAAANAIEIWWDGQLLETITASGIGLTSTAFQNYSFNLSSFTGDLTRLELRSQSPNNPPGFGGLVDNVRLYRRPVTIIDGADGVYDVVIEVTDSCGRQDRESFQITIADEVANRRPVIEGIENQTIDEGQTLELTIQATDPDQDPLTYELEGESHGATLDPISGLFRFATTEATGPNRFVFTVKVTDPAGLADQVTFTVDVEELNLPPILEAIEDQTISPGTMLEITAEATDPDIPANDLTFSLDEAPEGAVIDPVSGKLEWTAETAGEETFIVRVTDAAGLFSTRTFQVRVEEKDCLFDPTEYIVTQEGGEGAEAGSVVITDCDLVLSEGNSFEVSAAIDFVVGENPSSFVFEYSALAFDESDQGNVKDAFEVALVDAAGNSLVHPAAPGQDSFFNLTEPGAESAGINTVIEGNRISVDLMHLAAGTQATLIFRLVNNDGDTGTTVRVTPLEFGTALNTPAGKSDALARLGVEPPEIDLATLQNVTGSLQTHYGTTSFNDDAKTLFTSVRFENLANHPLNGPLVLVVRGISDPTVIPLQAVGSDPSGNRYYLLTDEMGNDSLEPGESTQTFRLPFFNPSENQFDFEFEILGNPNAAPEFVSTPETEGTVGVGYVYQAEAVDPDRDVLTFDLLSGPDGLEVNPETGRLTWRPDENQVGTHSVILEVTDGRGGRSIQQYEIEVLAERPNRPPVITSSPVVEAYLVPPADPQSTGALQFIELTPQDVASENGATFSTLPTENASIFGIEGDVRSVNFDEDPFGNPIASGSFLTIEYESIGIVLNNVQVSNSVYGGPASPPNTTITPAVPGEGLVFQFVVPVQAVGFINTSPDQDLVEFFDADGQLIFSTRDQDGQPGNFDVDRFIGAVADPSRPIASMRVFNNSGNLELDELVFVPVQATYEYAVEAVDPDEDPLRYQLDQAPEGMIIDSRTGKISWVPGVEQVGTHTVVVTVTDGRGGESTQEYQLRVLADPTNTAPIIISDPVADFFIPGFSNPASGNVSTQRIALDLGNGETFEGTVSITLDEDAARYADIVLAVDDSSSMGGDQAWVAEMIPLLDSALIAAGIGDRPEFPNRFAIIGFGGGRDGITFGHFLNSEKRTRYTLYGPDNAVVAEGNLNDVIPDELLNLTLPENGQYVLVVEAQNNADLATGIDIGIEGRTVDGKLEKELTLDTPIEGVLFPGQPVVYQFSTLSPGLFYFDSLTKDSRLTWQLESSEGVISIAREFGRPLNQEGMLLNLPADQYRLTIDAPTDVAATYRFAMLDLDSAPVLESGETVVTTFDLKSETRAFQIEIEAGKQFQLINNALGIHQGSRWRLVDDEGTVIASDAIGENLDRLTISGTGVYYLLFESELSPKEGFSQVRVPSTVEFTVTLQDPPPPIALTFGEPVENFIRFTGQTVEYEFTLDDRSLVYVDSLINKTMTWTLTGPQGTVISDRFFTSTDSFSNSSPVLDLFAGTYRLTVDGNGLTEPFAFQVVDLGSATEFTPGVPLEGQLTPANGTDLWKFQANAGDQFFLDVEAASDFGSSHLKLIDPFGQVISTGGLGDRSSISLLATGTYTVLVEGSLANTGEDTYRINLVPLTESVTELELNQVTSGIRTTPGEKATYTFSLADDGLLYFDSLTNNGQLVWSLAGPQGVEVSSRSFIASDSFANTNPAIRAVAGDYRLTVTSASDVTGEFGFRLSNLLDPTHTEPLSPNPGITNPTSRISGTITGNESLLYRLDTVSGDVLSWVTTGSGNVSYRLLNRHGGVVFNNTSLFNDRAEELLALDGTHYLLVEGRYFNAAEVPFEMDINWLRNDGPVTFSGDPLDLNTTTTGEFLADGQVDSYVFSLAENKLIYLDSLTNNGSIRWTLRGREGTIRNNIYFTSTDSFNNANPVFELVAGDYQLEIRASNGVRSEYGFRLVDLAAVSSINFGEAVTGDLTPANETDLYRFAAQAGDKIYVDVEAASDTSNTQLKLVDPAGRVVLITGSLADSGPITLELDGAYTLLVEGWRANTGVDTYRLVVHDIAVDPVPLVVGAEVRGVIAKPGQTATYTFNLPQRARINMDVLTGNPALSWSLNGPSGTVVSNRAFQRSDSLFGPDRELDLPPGDYTLSVKATGDTTAEFALVLRDLATAEVMVPGEVVSAKVDLDEGRAAIWSTGAPALAPTSNGSITLGSDDALEIPAATLDGLTDFTVEFWYRTTKSGQQVILSGANPVAGEILRLGLVNDTEFEVSGIGSWNIGSVSDGQWNHYAVVHEDGVGTRFLLNGVSQGTIAQSLGTLEIGDGGLFIGQLQRAFGGGFQTTDAAAGDLDELRIWSQVRTDTEIADDQDAVIDGATSGLAGYWRFDEASGSVAADETGAGRDIQHRPLSPSQSTRIFQFESERGDEFYFAPGPFENYTQTPYWRLVDAYGQEVFNVPFSNGFGPVVLGAGTHTLLVEGWATDVGLEGSFEFEVVALGNTIDPEPATPLVFGQEIESTLATIYGTDRYAFELTEPTLVHFDSLTNQSSLTWSLSRNGREVVAATRFDLSDAQSASNVLALGAGEYILAVTSPEQQAYAFQLLDLNDATAVEFDSAFSGTLDDGNQTRIYRVEADPGDRLFTNVISVNRSSGATLRVVDPLGKTVAFANNLVDIDTLVLSRGGTYFVLVEGKPNQTLPLDYQINLVRVERRVEPLNLGELVNDTITDPGDTVTYEFVLHEASQLYFDSLTNTSDIAWSLEGPAGRVVDQRRFNATDSFNFSDPVLRLEAGNYRLTIDGVSDTTGDFSFRLFDLNSAAAITFGDVVGGAGSEISNQTLAYQFEAVAGQNLLVDVESATDIANTLYRIYDRDWNKIAEQRSLSDLDEIEVDRTGTYMLLVEGWRGNNEADQFELSVHAETIRDAGLITLNTPILESVAARAERVRFRFDLAQDGLVHFDSQTNSANLTWTVTGPRGQEFDLRIDQVPSVPALDWVAGSYEVTVDGIGDATGDFQFAVLDLNDELQSTLIDPKLTGSATIESTQPQSRGTEAYRIDAVAGDVFSFNATAGTGTFSDYRLVDSFGRLVFSRFLTQDANDIELAHTGTYYLLVEGRLGNTIADEYSIEVTFDGNNPRSPLTGTAITFGSEIEGELTTVGQVDSYLIELTDRTQFYFDALSSNGVVRWRLTGPRGVEVDNLPFTSSDSFNSNDPVRNLLAGTYQLQVYASSGTPGTYAFRIENLAEALEIAPGTPFAGELDRPNETDIYRFTANSGDRFFFDVVETNDSNSTEYKLIDPFGRTYFESNRLNDVGLVELEYDGTYSLLIEGWIFNTGDDTYTFNVVPFAEQRQDLLIGQTQEAAIVSAGAESVFRVNLDEDSLFFFAPSELNGQFRWSLNDGEIDILPTRSFADGNGFYQLAAGEYELRVDGVGDATGVAEFATLISAATSVLPTDGTRLFTTLDGDNPRQVYRFSGAAGQQFALLPDYEMHFDLSAKAAETAGNFIASLDPEDGYSGLQMALRADAFREGAAVNYILVTDEDRDVAEDSVTFESLFEDLFAQSALLNVVTRSGFQDNAGRRAIGVDSEGNAYIADGSGGFTIGSGGITTQTDISFLQDYIELGWGLGGANWDLNLLRAGGLTAQSFTNAFVDVKVEEILKQTSLRLISSSPTADFEVLSPPGGVYSDIAGGQQYDFDIRIGNDGRARSFDLLFQQGQTVGSIPVFIVAPYEYGALATDPDGDTLIWSLVAGPSGLMIDPATGYLTWTADDISFGEHEVIIRVADQRGGFDEQAFTLSVNGGEPASLGGRVVDINTTSSLTVGAVVPGNANPYLAGMPIGSTASSGDMVPDESPMLVDGFLTGLIPGTVMTFSASGAVTFTGAPPLPDATPDGDANLNGSHFAGDTNGISGFVGPWNALMGVFLSDEQPNFSAAPETLDFSGNGNVAGGINYTGLAPQLQQLFFIGDGITDDGIVQEVTIPEGATRLVLGTSDGFGWFNNAGLIEVEVTAQQLSLPVETQFTVFLDSNRNGLLDDGERSTTTDEVGNFEFTDLAAGTYTVVQQPLVGWSLRSPQSRSFEITVDPGESIDNLLFTNTRQPLENTDPVIISQPPQSVVAGESLEYQPLVEELDGDTLRFDLPLAPYGMVVNPDTGKIIWRPNLDQVGSQNVVLRVRDEFGGYDLQVFQLDVSAPNTAPVITSTAPTGPAGVGLPYQYLATAVDADGDEITWSLETGPEGMSIDPLTGAIDWIPDAAQVGTHEVVARAADGRGLQSDQAFEVTVELDPENVAPVFLSEPPLEVRLGDNLLYLAVAFDQNGDPITFELDQAPAGMTVLSSGLLEWQPSPSQLGENPVRLLAVDGRGGVAVQEFNVVVETQPVNLPPRITSVPIQTALVDVPYSFQVEAEDPNQDTIIWSLETGPRGMAIDPRTGQVSWAPGVNDLGVHEVLIQATDTSGATSQLGYNLLVRAVNTPPVILSAPRTLAAVGATYLYQVGARDADQDALRFDLESGPAGMVVDPVTGLVQWTPIAGQEGPQQVTLRVSDSAGASVTQRYTIEVATGTVNGLPVIDSTPGFFATVDETYTYQVNATDPDGDLLTYELRQSPPGMELDAATGLLTWTPAAADLGTTLVELIARDPAGAGSIQQFSLTVLAANNAPVIESTPTETATAGEAYRYDVLARDADGEFLFYELTEAPEGMVIDGLGRIFWAPTSEQLGDQSVTVTVTDIRGARATQSYRIEVTPDTSAPEVVILLSNNPVNVGETVDVRVQAVDNVEVTDLLLTVNGVAVGLDAGGTARIATSEVGVLNLVATATDAAGNSAQNEIDLFVADPNDVDGPQISIDSPGEGAILTDVTDVIGTVFDETLVSYRLLLRAFDSSQFRVVDEGNQNVEDGVLGRLDPTLLQNGSYVLRLEAFDASGNGNVIEQSVEIGGQTKIGNFQLAFTDVSVALAGIPISIVRTYDTLKANEQGDFGFGWSLGIWDANLSVNVPESGLEDYGIYNPFRIGTRVYITLPDGTREGFTFDPALRTLPGFGNSLTLATPRFTADPGVTSTLSVGGGRLLVNEFGELSAGGGVPWNPLSPDFGGGFTLTTREGIRYRINGETGQFESVTDRNGNQLTLAAGGILSNTGSEILFERDVLGRITRITDPNGNSVEYSYDAAGDLVAVNDLNGNTTTFEYDEDIPHYLESVIDPLGRTGSRSEYDEEGRLIRVFDAAGVPVELAVDLDSQIQTVKDRRGFETTYIYDARGNVTSIIDALGGVIANEFDANNNLVSQTDQLGNTTTYTYDSRGNQLSVTDPLGHTRYMTYNSSGQMLSLTDELGNTTTNEYDAQGNLVKTVDALGGVSSATYDAEGNLLQQVDPAGRKTTLNYENGVFAGITDDNGDTLSVTTDANGTFLGESFQMKTSAGVRDVSWDYGYLNDGTLNTVTNSDGSTSSITRDAAGQITSTTNAFGNTQTINYDERGLITGFNLFGGSSITTELDEEGNAASFSLDGNVSEREYDALGRVTRATSTSGQVVAINYDAAGRVLSQTDQDGRQTLYEYDAAGRMISKTLPDGSEFLYEYDAAGRQVAQKLPTGETNRLEYDDLGRVVRSTYFDGTFEASEYDAVGNLIEFTSREGLTWQYSYTYLNALSSITDPIGNVTLLTSDNFGNLESVTDALGRTTEVAYDEYGNRIRKELPLGQVQSVTYSSDGVLLSETRFDGSQLKYRYDDQQRLVEILDENDEVVETRNYSETGLVTVITEGHVTSTRVNSDDVVESWTSANGIRVEYDYANGILTAFETDGGRTQLEYSDLGQLLSITHSDGSATTILYDSNGFPVGTRFEDGTQILRELDADGSHDRIYLLDASDNLLYDSTYERDSLGRITRINRADGSWTGYEYDALGRLSREQWNRGGNVTETSYVYDAVGNLIQKDVDGTVISTSYDDNDRIVSSNGWTYTYNDKGDLIQRTDGQTTEVFTYDRIDRLIRFQRSGADPQDIEYVYDTDGILVERIHNGEVTKYVWERQSSAFAMLLETRDANDEVIARFEYDGIRYSRVHVDGGPTYRVVTDHLGTIQALFHDGGSIQFEYDAFGKLLSGDASLLPLGFTGGILDPITGLTYLRSRWYDPEHGRFTQTDSVDADYLDSRSFNRYVYAVGDPVNRIDPSGQLDLKETLTVTFIIGVVAATTFIVASPSAAEFISRGVVDYDPVSGNNYPFFTVSKTVNFFGSKKAGLGIGAEIGLELLTLNTGMWDIYFTYGMDLAVNAGASTGGSEKGTSSISKFLTNRDISSAVRLATGTAYDTYDLWEYTGPFLTITAGAFVSAPKAGAAIKAVNVATGWKMPTSLGGIYSIGFTPGFASKAKNSTLAHSWTRFGGNSAVFTDKNKVSDVRASARFGFGISYYWRTFVGNLFQ